MCMRSYSITFRAMSSMSRFPTKNITRKMGKAIGCDLAFRTIG